MGRHINYNFLKCAKYMPNLSHSLGDAKDGFDISKSEVVNWLVNQPDVKGVIVYNLKKAKWRGVDYSDGIF